MRSALAAFARNLAAGLRTATFLPVSRLAFRISVGQLLLLFILSAAIDFAGDYLRLPGQRELSLLGAGSELFAAALLLLSATIISLVNRQPRLLLAVAVIVMSALPVIQVGHYTLVVAAGAYPGYAASLYMAEQFLLFWMIVMLIRSVWLGFAPPPPRAWLRAIAGGVLLALPVWFSGLLAPSEPWWRDASETQQPTSGLNAGAEAVLATQAYLLAHALDDLADERPGTTDLYFVGFAPYGGQDVFRKDVEAAQKVMDDKWGTRSRSLVLLNNPRTLLTAPFASVTNLRETLNEIGDAIDPEDDVVMLYLVSHGSKDHRLSADQPPLALVELTPLGLRQLLDDAGIKWRVIVVSACYSGGFIEPLKDDNTLIVTASRADRVSFGCEDRSESTYFGEAFFQSGLLDSITIPGAFEKAKERVADREQREGQSPPSEPQLWMGPAIAEKLPLLRRRGPNSMAALGTRSGR